VVEHTTGPLARYLPTGSDHRWVVAVSQLERPDADVQPMTVAVTVEDVSDRSAPVELVVEPVDARLIASLLVDAAERADASSARSADAQRSTMVKPPPTTAALTTGPTTVRSRTSRPSAS
jgi:hypothetical protein